MNDSLEEQKKRVKQQFFQLLKEGHLQEVSLYQGKHEVEFNINIVGCDGDNERFGYTFNDQDVMKPLFKKINQNLDLLSSIYHKIEELQTENDSLMVQETKKSEPDPRIQIGCTYSALTLEILKKWMINEMKK